MGWGGGVPSGNREPTTAVLGEENSTNRSPQPLPAPGLSAYPVLTCHAELGGAHWRKVTALGTES